MKGGLVGHGSEIFEAKQRLVPACMHTMIAVAWECVEKRVVCTQILRLRKVILKTKIYGWVKPRSNGCFSRLSHIVGSGVGLVAHLADNAAIALIKLLLHLGVLLSNLRSYSILAQVLRA